MLRSAVGKTCFAVETCDEFRNRPSTLAVKLSVSAIYYPQVTATERIFYYYFVILFHYTDDGPNNTLIAVCVAVSVLCILFVCILLPFVVRGYKHGERMKDLRRHKHKGIRQDKIR